MIERLRERPTPSSCRSTASAGRPARCKPHQGRRCASGPRKLPPLRPGRRRLWPRPRPSRQTEGRQAARKGPKMRPIVAVSEGRILAPRFANGRYGLRPPRIFRIRINDTARYDSVKNRKKTRNSAIFAVSVCRIRRHETRGGFNPPLLVLRGVVSPSLLLRGAIRRYVTLSAHKTARHSPPSQEHRNRAQ